MQCQQAKVRLFFLVPTGKTSFSPCINDKHVIFFPLLVHHIVQDGQNPSNGSVADKTSRYDIGELATSSLIGETDTQTQAHTHTSMFSSCCVAL